MPEQDSIPELQAAWQVLSRQALLPAVQDRLAASIGVAIPRTARIALVHLAERGTSRVSDLATLSGVEISTMSRSLRHLDDAGFIRRDPGEDLRAVLVSTTPAGETAVSRLVAAGLEMLSEALGAWPESDRRQLAALMRRFAEDVASYVAATGGRIPTGAPRA